MANIISVLLPTRGRKEVLFNSLKTLIEKADNHKRVELILGIDEDDVEVNLRLKFQHSNCFFNFKVEMGKMMLKRRLSRIYAEVEASTSLLFQLQPHFNFKVEVEVE